MWLLLVHSLVLFLLVLVYAFRFRKSVSNPEKNILVQIQEATKVWKSTPHLILLSAFALFLLFPLSLGFTFFLQTDANVLVVIVWIIWAYNWSKYSFFRE
ncbi:LIC10362 family protein [Leptospira soteropolitanensis]|uniref:LIC10362 family protein n=1 Tax=Leptospira soteropolitanensis TaxID=2950025 RepID=UPI003898EB45